MWAEKKSLLSKLMKNMLTRKKLQMVTYTIGKAYDKKIIRQNMKKNCLTLIAKKKDCFLSEVKKKICKQQFNSRLPPHLSNGASLSKIPLETNPILTDSYIYWRREVYLDLYVFGR